MDACMKIDKSELTLTNQYQGTQKQSVKRTEINIAQNEQQNLEPPAALENKQAEDILNGDSSQIYILKLLVQKLTGKKIDWIVGKDISHAEMTQLVEQANASDENRPTHAVVETLKHESQANVLSLNGKLTLEEGKEIEFAFKISFEQSHTSYQRNIESLEFKDPLIISFTNKAVQLDTSKTSFDLDADGKNDTFSQLEKGYGYLAFDRNGNNKIDDGTELFGALSGNGFADLSQFDNDQNGFIDENDDIFDSLRVWVKNAQEDKLISLEEANIGAISVKNVETPFNLRAEGKLQGAIRKSGFYVDSDGKAGLIQQIDFVV